MNHQKSPQFKEYKKILEQRRMDPGNLSIRARGKKTRFFIDNEYFAKGYGAIFRHYVFAVYGVLAKYANQKSQTCYPSIPRIMGEVGTKNRNTIVNAIKLLEAYSIISVQHSPGKVTNFYTLLDTNQWRPVNSINLDTVLKRKANPALVIKNDPQQ